MSEPVIRPFNPGDASAVRALAEAITKEDILYGQVAETTEDIAAFDPRFFFVAESGGGIVGCVAGKEAKAHEICIMPEGERYLWVEAIYVGAGWRDGGLGTRLLDRMMAAAKEQGITRFRVYTAAKDFDRAVGFYRSHGFKPWYAELFI
jgi:N-acetylglutamate synthase-like GNAT family acetyltransferase